MLSSLLIVLQTLCSLPSGSGMIGLARLWFADESDTRPDLGEPPSREGTQAWSEHGAIDGCQLRDIHHGTSRQPRLTFAQPKVTGQVGVLEFRRDSDDNCRCNPRSIEAVMLKYDDGPSSSRLRAVRIG